MNNEEGGIPYFLLTAQEGENKNVAKTAIKYYIPRPIPIKEGKSQQMKEVEIKAILLKTLKNESPSCVLGAEFPFQFGERRADIVKLEGKELFAYEIKGRNDKAYRLKEQMNSYRKYFDYCFVVCEEINLNEVRRHTPKEIGIMIAKNKKIFNIRKSKKFIRHDKMSLASTLSIKELKTMSKGVRARSKFELCQHVAKIKNLDELRESSRNEFSKKYKAASNLLRQETTQIIHSDDIHTITKKSPDRLLKKPLS